MTGPQTPLDARLRMLEQILGETCRLSDEIAEDKKESLRKTLIPNILPLPKASVMSTSTTESDTCIRFTHFSAGDRAPENTTFCSWNSVTSYPDLFIGKKNRPIARPFFDDIAHGGDWDFFYLHNPKQPSKQPIVFVTTEQFEFYLRFINRRLGLALKLPNGQAKAKFVLRFGHNLPQPRYLKSSHGTWQLEEHSEVENKNQKIESFTEWPSISAKDVTAFDSASSTEQQTWMAQWVRICSEKKTGGDSLTPEQRFQNILQQRMKQLKQSQDLLGLTGVPGNAVLVSVDVEWLESGDKPVSEIGIAFLDTKKLEFPQILQNKTCWGLIQAHHCRTYEYAGLRNYQFVQGCPDKFEFGESTFPHFKELAREVNSLIRQFEGRKLVLVGHDIGNDLRCLESIGVNLTSNFIAHLDTQVVHQAWQQSDSARSLAALLNDLDYQPRHLHNAGNDAVWTLRALVGMAVGTCDGVDK